MSTISNKIKDFMQLLFKRKTHNKLRTELNYYIRRFSQHTVLGRVPEI